MSETPTEELARQVARMNEEREKDRQRRHDLNNKLGVALLSMDADIKRHEEGMQGVENIGKIVLELNHLVRGVDGKNGLRGSVKDHGEAIVKLTDKLNTLDQRIEAKFAAFDQKVTEQLGGINVRLAGLAAGFAIAGSMLSSFLVKWIS